MIERDQNAAARKLQSSLKAWELKGGGHYRSLATKLQGLVAANSAIHENQEACTEIHTMPAGPEKEQAALKLNVLVKKTAMIAAINTGSTQEDAILAAGESVGATVLASGGSVKEASKAAVAAIQEEGGSVEAQAEAAAATIIRAGGAEEDAKQAVVATFEQTGETHEAAAIHADKAYTPLSCLCCVTCVCPCG